MRWELEDFEQGIEEAISRLRLEFGEPNDAQRPQWREQLIHLLGLDFLLES